MLDAFIYLYGPPGSGKSELGRRLAQALDLPFYDLDARIEAAAGRSVADIFSQEGEASFRQRESQELARLALPAVRAETGERPGVVALGGGALLNPYNRRLAEASGTVMCLSAPFETLMSRVQAGQIQAERAAGRGTGGLPRNPAQSVANGGLRPLLQGDVGQRLASLLEQRREHYASFPMQFSGDDRPPDDNVWLLQVQLGTFRVRGMGNPYDVRVAEGGLAGLGAALRQRGLKGPLGLVTDSNLAPGYLAALQPGLETAGYQVTPVVIPAGEAHKTVATVQRLWEAFVQGGLERGSTVLALGGGVVGDLAGFAAATYLRGVPWVGLPTSLLAMVDSSLGGKTGADLPQGKNLVGAFHPPALVLIDPLALHSLPDAELRNGLAEVIKHGIIADPGLFELCARGRAALDGRWSEVVRRAVAVKARVIEADPFERGQRAALNLGHSLGHAIESVSGFRIRHGEAVAIGTRQAARLAERLGLAAPDLVDTISAALASQGLPLELPPDLERAQLLAGMGVDKKRLGGRLRAVLPVRIGEVRWGVELDDPAALLDA